MVFLNNFSLMGSDLPSNSLTLAVTSQTQGFTQMPGTSVGNLCLGGAIGRFLPQAAASGVDGTVSLDINLNGLPQPTATVAVMPGDTWNFQLWFRDSLGGQPVSNFTQGVEVTFN